MGRPILINKDSNIHVYQPLIEEIVDMGEDMFQRFVIPYTLTTEAIFNGLDNVDELVEKYHMWDLFFILNEDGGSILDSVLGGNALDALTEGLKFFLHADEVKILPQRHKVIIDNSYLIDDKEFDSLRKVIQGVIGRGDVEFEKTPKDMSKRQKDIWFKLQAGRRRRAEKEALHLQDLINFTCFGGNAYIPLREIDSMTYFQLNNAYKSIMGMDAYRTGMAFKLSQKFEVKDEIKHWMDSLKIGS